MKFSNNLGASATFRLNFLSWYLSGLEVFLNFHHSDGHSNLAYKLCHARRSMSSAVAVLRIFRLNSSAVPSCSFTVPRIFLARRKIATIIFVIVTVFDLS